MFVWFWCCGFCVFQLFESAHHSIAGYDIVCFVDILNIEVHWLAFLGGTGSLRVRLKDMEAGYPDFVWSSLTPVYGVQHSEMGRSCIAVVHSYVS